MRNKTIHPQKKRVDIGDNCRWNNTLVWILVALVSVAGGIGMIKWWQQRQIKNEMYSGN